jgi:hypothetical protein
LNFLSKIKHEDKNLAISFEQSEISFFHAKFPKDLRFVSESSLLKADGYVLTHEDKKNVVWKDEY